MTNQTTREPHLNNVQVMVPLSNLDNTGVTGTGLDMGDVNNPNHIVVVTVSDLTDIARVFVTIQESFEGGSVWNTIGQFPALTAHGTVYQTVKRTKRFLRAVITTEPPASPVAPAFEAVVLLLS